MKPSAEERVASSKGVTVLTTSVALVFNPFIYTLRNEQMKQALKYTVKKGIFTTLK